MTANDYRMTRRSIFIGAAASLICMPALVRAASLMPIRRVIVATNPINPKKPIYLGFAGALRLHWMKQALKRGWDNRHDGRTFGGISETEARNYVAYVRSQGTLPPRGATVSDLTKVGFSRSAALGRVASLGDQQQELPAEFKSLEQTSEAAPYALGEFKSNLPARADRRTG